MGSEVKIDGGGLRHNAGKVPLHLLPWDCIWLLAKVFQAGNAKYPGDGTPLGQNYLRGQSASTMYASLQRHLFRWWVLGESWDKETGCHHLAMAAWNVFGLLTYEIRGMFKALPALDDRPLVDAETAKWLGEVLDAEAAAAESVSVAHAGDPVPEIPPLEKLRRAARQAQQWQECADKLRGELITGAINLAEAEENGIIRGAFDHPAQAAYNAQTAQTDDSDGWPYMGSGA